MESPANQTVTASTHNENRERRMTGRARCIRDIGHKVEGKEGKGGFGSETLDTRTEILYREVKP